MKEIQELFRKIEERNLWDNNLVLKRNEYLCVSGDLDTNLYFITSGSLKISVVFGEEEYIVRFGYQQNFIAALDSFITEKPSDFYIQAIRETSLKIISKSNYLRFINSNPKNKEICDRLLEGLLLQQLEREKDILISSPKERYERVFKRSPQLFQEIPNKHIAAYLRMTPETLSRLKKS